MKQALAIVSSFFRFIQRNFTRVFRAHAHALELYSTRCDCTLFIFFFSDCQFLLLHHLASKLLESALFIDTHFVRALRY